MELMNSSIRSQRDQITKIKDIDNIIYEYNHFNDKIKNHNRKMRACHEELKDKYYYRAVDGVMDILDYYRKNNIVVFDFKNDCMEKGFDIDYINEYGFYHFKIHRIKQKLDNLIG